MTDRASRDRALQARTLWDQAFVGSNPGANGPQQERRQMRMIGRLRCGIALGRGGFGAADRRGARGRRLAHWRECCGGCLRLRGGAAASIVAARLAVTAWLAASARTLTRTFARTRLARLFVAAVGGICRIL
jgi:hypothetical protein